MYLVFATNPNNNTLYIGYVTGPLATQLAQWMRNEPGTHDTITLPGLPILIFSSDTPSDFQVGHWSFGAMHGDRRVSAQWAWGRGKSLLPPQRSFQYRSFMLDVEQGPTFRCVGVDDFGTPLLDLNYCDGTGTTWTMLNATVVQITEPLMDTNGNKRKFQATFPDDACHNDDHNHAKRGDDDSPPPPGQGKRVKHN